MERRGGRTAKPIVVDGVTYESISEAARKLGVSWYRVKAKAEEE